MTAPTPAYTYSFPLVILGPLKRRLSPRARCFWMAIGPLWAAGHLEDEDRA